MAVVHHYHAGKDQSKQIEVVISRHYRLLISLRPHDQSSNEPIRYPREVAKYNRQYRIESVGPKPRLIAIP